MKRYVAVGAVALVALLTMAVGLAGADSYTTNFEGFTLGTVDGQGSGTLLWHSAVPGDIPALPNGYDQAVVDNSYAGFPAAFGTKALRVSNAYTEPSGEFFFQTYSPSVGNPAGESETNKVFEGSFQFYDPAYQPDLFVSVSPDNGVGARMSYVSLEDTAAGIDITFYDTNATGAFVAHPVGTYSHGAVHTVRFLIQTVPGAPGDTPDGTDIVRLYIDDDEVLTSECLTTWEQYYRVGEKHEPGVIDSFEFRTAGDGTTISSLIGHGYLFDNVSTETRNTDGPAAGCGAPPPTATLNVTKFYDANANGTKDPGEPDINDWQVKVANGSTQDGLTPFTATLAPGDYTASESSPVEPNWHPTTDTSFTKTLADGADESVSFGNVCTGDGGGLTTGFWANKNGQKLVGPDDLEMLRDLNLRNADGSDFDPTTAAQVKSWLSKATATNMAYMLSAQLAAMELNVLNGMVAGSDLVYAPGVISGEDFITVTQLMDAANAALGIDGSTPSGDPNRSLQTTLKNALYQANQDNSTSFVQAEPCTFTFPPPVCNAGTGSSGAGYNAIPTDVMHCSPPSEGFEANSDNELGDRVKLDTSGGTKLVSMTVDFQSYGCQTSGHWNTGDCVTPDPAGTFTVPGGITAKIYDAATLTPIATSNVLNPSIPFRPSAIPDASCPNAPADPNALNSRFKDPVSGQCAYSLSVPLTFTFPAGTTFTSGQEVVWTVQFNTTHAGYAPIISNLPPQACAATTNPGCGYDSLNVGAKTYAPNAFAGIDVNEDVVYRSHGNANYGPPFVALGPESGWTGYRPLGEIVLGP